MKETILIEKTENGYVIHVDRYRKDSKVLVSETEAGALEIVARELRAS